VELHSACTPFGTAFLTHKPTGMHVADANALSDCHRFVQILTAAKDPFRKPCLVFGEPGLEKDNIAALLHFGSADRTKPMIQVRCWDKVKTLPLLLICGTHGLHCLPQKTKAGLARTAKQGTSNHLASVHKHRQVAPYTQAKLCAKLCACRWIAHSWTRT